MVARQYIRALLAYAESSINVYSSLILDRVPSTPDVANYFRSLQCPNNFVAFRDEYQWDREEILNSDLAKQKQ
jgi:hypothetical protein